jgi:hypothetical protein
VSTVDLPSLDELFFNIDTSRFPSPDKLYDNTQERTPGYWFSENPDTRALLKPILEAYYLQLADKAEFRKDQVNPDLDNDTLVFQYEKTRKWLADFKEYLYLEATAIHFTSGK